jgi:hypothetical protein
MICVDIGKAEFRLMAVRSALGPGCVKTLSLYLWIWNRWAAVILGVDFSVFAVSMAGAKLKSRICRSEGRFGRIGGEWKPPRA